MESMQYLDVRFVQQDAVPVECFTVELNCRTKRVELNDSRSGITVESPVECFTHTKVELSDSRSGITNRYLHVPNKKQHFLNFFVNHK